MHVFKKPNFNGVRQLLTGNLTWLSCICRIEIGLADPLKGISEGQKVNSPPHSSCCTLPAIALWNTSKVWQPRHQLLIQKENFHEEIFFCQLLSYILHFLSLVVFHLTSSSLPIVPLPKSTKVHLHLQISVIVIQRDLPDVDNVQAVVNSSLSILGFNESEWTQHYHTARTDCIDTKSWTAI